MKLRNRYRFNRYWLAMGIVLAGVLAGYLVGRQSILHITKSRLEQYAGLIIEREDDIGDEITDTFKLANASTEDQCSDEDIALLRRLTFVARFLKDVGRIKDNLFLCSATIGRVVAPSAMLEPDVYLPGDMRFYESYPLLKSKERAAIVAAGNADVVVSPDVLAEFAQQPISFVVRVVDEGGYAGQRSRTGGQETGGQETGEQGTAKQASAKQASAKQGAGEQASAKPASAKQGAGEQEAGVVIDGNPVLREKPNVQRVRRSGDGLLLDRCSSRYPICVTTRIKMESVWQGTRPLLYGYVATGGTAGTSCALVLLLAGRKRRSPTNQLKRAILMGKLTVAYQPVVQLGSNRIVGAEALARWTDEEGESIRPETIIALAEAQGFVSEITRFIVTRSLQELRPVFDIDPEFQISINLAPSDLVDPRLLLLLDESLSMGTITPANIAFELPERATFDREIAVAAIRRLRERGHAVYIDDFGTGYSNLAYLNELNVDGIKINRTFIATIGTDSVTASIVPQILAVAETLSLKVVLQGIERAEQASYFRRSNPQMLAQGWFFGMAVPARSLLFLCAEKTE